MIFVLLVFTLVVLFHLYLWKRLVRDTTRPGRARRIGNWVMLGLTVLVFVTLIVGRFVGPEVSRWFSWPGYVWFGLMVYLLVFLALLELPRLALRRWARGAPLVASATTDVADVADVPAAPPVASRRVFISRVAAVTAGVASAGMVGTGMVSALGPPELTRVRIPLRRLDPSLAGFRIAVVADIHLGPLRGRGHTERIVRMINETSPDLVAVVGDLVDGTVPELGSAAEPLRDLVSREGTFFVTGNHEYFSGYQPWLTELERLGVHPLRNERTSITRGGAAFELAGVNDVIGESYADGPDFDRALSGRDPSRPVVLLAHQPIQVDDAVAHDVDVQLSGHTHGGQLYPFHYIVRLAQPSVSGLSKVDDTWLYVTRGAGFWGPPVRIGAAPEITIVELDRG
jgi:predicted MPP superfamily phosphohydrolase